MNGTTSQHTLTIRTNINYLHQLYIGIIYEKQALIIEFLRA